MKFSELKVGDIFRFQNITWMKTRELHYGQDGLLNAVVLSDGGKLYELYNVSRGSWWGFMSYEEVSDVNPKIVEV